MAGVRFEFALSGDAPLLPIVSDGCRSPHPSQIMIDLGDRIVITPTTPCSPGRVTVWSSRLGSFVTPNNDGNASAKFKISKYRLSLGTFLACSSPEFVSNRWVILSSFSLQTLPTADLHGCSTTNEPWRMHRVDTSRAGSPARYWLVYSHTESHLIFCRGTNRAQPRDFTMDLACFDSHRFCRGADPRAHEST
jgi:hypothetical protein